MAQLYNRRTGAFTEDLNEIDLWDHLRDPSGDYEFNEGANGDEVAIHITDPKDPDGLGQINLMNREDAKDYIISGEGSYRSAEEVHDWLNKEEHGDNWGSTAAAAALGAGGALTLGIVPAAARLMSDDAANIMDANPGWMIGSDILTTIASLAFAPVTGGAALGLGVGAAGRLGARAGLKTLLAAAKKEPFKALAKGVTAAPRGVHRIGQKVEAKIGEKFLKDAAEEQLKSSAWRGLLPRMAGYGTEALIYSAGYNLPQAIDDKLKGRSWGDVATVYGLQMGMGTTLGLAMPGVIHGLAGLAQKTIAAGGRNNVRPIKWALNTTMAKNAMQKISEGAADMNPDTIYSRAGRKLNMVEALTTAHLDKSAGKQMRDFSSQLGKMVEKTVKLMGGEFDNHKLIKSIDQAGHLPSVVKKWVKQTPVRRSGSANPFVLADQMLNGNFGRKETGLSAGLIPELRRRTQKLPPLVRDSAEMQGVLGDLDILENNILEWVRKMTLKEFNPGALAGVTDTRAGFAKAAKKFDSWLRKPARKTRLKNFEEWIKKYAKYGPGMTAEQHIIVAHLAIDDWMHHGNALVNQKSGLLSKASVDFIADTFVQLEQLSARVHATRGAATASDITESWAKDFTRQITEVLSNTGETWSVRGGPTAFGYASLKKNEANRLLRGRSEQHKILWDKFHSPDKDFPDAGKIDPGKVEGLLRNINYGEKEHAADMLGAYANKNFELLNYLKAHYDISGFIGKELKESAINKAVKESRGAKLEIKNHLKLMKTDMADALEWAAIMNADNKLSMAVANRGLMPWSIGTGAAVGLGAAALGLGTGGAAALGAVAGVGRAGQMAVRGAYDAMSNPGRAMASIDKFFIAANKGEEFITGETNRYFTWLNKVGKDPGTSRLVYEGPGGDKYGRYPAIFSALSSKYIADYVSGKRETVVAGELVPWAGELESYAEEK